MKKAAQLVFVVVGGAFVIFVFAGLLTPVKYDREEEDLRWKIQQCWRNQEKKSNTPDEARFIAGVCEGLDDQYLNKYRKRAPRD